VSVVPLDLHHQGRERVVGVYVVETPEGLALCDCGPGSTVTRLQETLRERGLELRDLRHLLLTHIHLDHSGGAGVLVREHPELQVHVSELGAPHLVDPSRLERSARRIFGAAFDELWGEIAPVPAENVHVVGARVAGLECFPTPGHASHHVSYLHEDGTLYVGDAGGVRINPGRPILPVTPPPDVDVEAWLRSMDAIEARAPARLALVHYGVTDDPADHMARLRTALETWSTRVREGMDEDDFVRVYREELTAEVQADAEMYELAGPVESSWAGLRRYWDKRANAAA
jgi:glyoxylase-like metal-dependent hydrolase (beta-lactamase superfamily II)